MTAPWRVAKSLHVLLQELNALAPKRHRASDGSIGDAAHAARDSDHNPWVKEGNMGIVTACDFTHDPERGADMHSFVAHLVKRRDPRIKYIIWDKRIWRSYDKPSIPAWTPSAYTGSNGHTHHAHISVKSDKALYDSTASWGLSKAGGSTGVATGTVVTSSGGSTSATTQVKETKYEAYREGMTPGSRLLQQGNAGSDVKWVQKRLGVRADGYFGAVTKQSVMDWQRAHKLKVDGIVGSNTWNSLKAGQPVSPGDRPVPQPLPLPQPQPVVQGGATDFTKGNRHFTSHNGYPIYAQGDKDWGSIVIASSTGKNVHQIGCAMTSVAMALSGIAGKAITPGELAEFLKSKKEQGFTSYGGIYWNTAGLVVSPPVQLTKHDNFKAADVDKELEKGRPVAIEVDYYKKVDGKQVGAHDKDGDHWFLITGRTPDKKTYQASDPAGGVLITLHRLPDGRLESDHLTRLKTPYITVGTAVTFSRGPAKQVAANNPQAGQTGAPTVVTLPTTSTTTSSGSPGTTGGTTAGLPQPSREVERAIREAASKVGVDYGYMMAMAAQESSFNPGIQAKTSSATGLYQFLNQSWLGIVKLHGAKHGLSAYANKINYSKSEKKYVVNPASDRQAILDLRKQAVYSALMGAEFAKDNQTYLTKKLGRAVGPTDLYMAHFLGPAGAARFLAARDAGKGSQSAAALFPDAASANTSIFYKKGKLARSLDEVYAVMTEKIVPRANAYSRARLAA